MLHPLVWPLPLLPLKINTGTHPWSDIFRGNNGGSSCGCPSISTCKSTKGWAICLSRDLIFIRDSITPCSDRNTNLARDELPHSTRASKSSKGSIFYWPGRNINLSRGESISSLARSSRVTRGCITLSHRSFSFSTSTPFSSGSRNLPWNWTKPCSSSGSQTWGNHLHLILLSFISWYPWLGNVILSGSGSVIIKPTNGEQSNCRDEGKGASNLIRGSVRKAQGNFCLAAKRGPRSDQRPWLFRGQA
jgi:hypothetical protein